MTNTMDELLVNLLGKLNGSSNDIGKINASTLPSNATVATQNSSDIVFHATGAPGPAYYATQTHPFSPFVPLGFDSPTTTHLVMSAHEMYPVQSMYQAQQPTYPAVGPLPPTQLPTPSSTTVPPGAMGFTVITGQDTTPPHAFAAGSLHDPTTRAWNMDTGASSHLNNLVTSLSDVFNMCIYPSVSVGDYHSIPVTNTGHSILPTPFGTLHLNNDFMTRRVLLRCDSTGDLYPITAPSPIPYVFLCDHCGEFDNRALHKLFSDNGIEFCFSCPKTSQQNGKSERMVRTINNLIRTLLFQANLPLTFWIEALNMSTHLLNILPSTTITNEIPYTRLFGKHPDYSVLRTFGCLCYPHLYPNHKLEPRATPSILLRHASNNRGYRCLDLKMNKIVISRHVTFDETIFLYGSNQPALPPTYTFLDDISDIIPPAIPTNPDVQLPPEPITLIHNTQIQQQPDAAQLPTIPPTNHRKPSPLTDPMHVHDPTMNTYPNLISRDPKRPVAQSPIIILDPPKNPNPISVHPMVTRCHVGTNRPTKHLNLHVSSISSLPKYYRDAFSDSNWQNAMRYEYTALIKNKTWILVPRPLDTNIVHCMWLFRHKYLADGTLSRYKARLVANGSTQLEGVDVDETFSLVVKSGTIRTVLSLVTSRDWPINQLDVKNAFLHGILSETVYMHQPPGFQDSVHPDYVCLLQRSLYGLRQAPELGFSGLHLILLVLVFLIVVKYVAEILDRAHMVNCNPSRTPIDTESKLGSDDDLVSDPTLYRSLADLVAFSYADWTGCPTTRRLTSEAEYRGVANAVDETCWLRNLLRELHTPLFSATLVYCDNVSAVYLSYNPVHHQRTKHIEIDIYFVRDLVAVGQVRVLYVPSRYQYAYIFTKGLPLALFEEFRTSLSIRCPPAPTARGVSPFGRDEAVKTVHADVQKVNSGGNNNCFHSSNIKPTSYVNAVKNTLNDGKRNATVDGDNSNVIEIKQNVSNDFPLAILGCYKDFCSIANTRSLCQSEGFLEVDFKYLGGLWILLEFKGVFVSLRYFGSESDYRILLVRGISSWFSSMKPWHDDFVVDERLVWLEIEGVPLRAWENDTFKSICSKWGDVIFSDDSDLNNRLSKRLCIKSTHSQLIFATLFVSLNKINYAIRIRELCSWTPTFVGGDSTCDEEVFLGNYTTEEEDVHEEEKEEVHKENDVDFTDGIFEDEVVVKDDVVTQKVHENSNIDVVPTDDKDGAPTDSDPFGLEQLINKKRGKDCDVNRSVTLDFPPGSTYKDLGDSYKAVGFSLLERLEETIKVGLTLGLNMEGCESTLAGLIANNEECKETKMIHVDMWMLRQVWGNSHFNFASLSARGLSGVEGMWTPNNIKIMWVAVYGPQSLSSKITLWSSLANMIANWEGIFVAMGDFNEVRKVGERFGSHFNERQAAIFNTFISNASLIDVPLGGYKFTWTDKWGSKMSKLSRFLISEDFYDYFPYINGVILEKGIPNHRPILLKEYVANFDLTPFCFFHSWLDMDGFHNLVVETWNNDGIVEANGLVLFKKKLQHLKRVIREWIATKRLDSTKTKDEHLSRLSSIDILIDQGLAIDLDFSNRRDSTRILGILNEGEWIKNPDSIKNAFLDHFHKWFHQSCEPTPYFDVDMPNPISSDQRDFLERSFSRDEIKRAVWDCGGDRAPGPDGFTFKFFTTFWDLLEKDVICFVQSFFSTGSFPKGCNLSFIALISKFANATLVTDFRPISLIGFQYKIIGKILANRLSAVIGSCISPEQSAFLKRRNILDSPLILNEIKGCLRYARSSVLVNGSPTDEFEISRGLRQGDHLSPFLFILAMEGLHALIYKAMDMDIYNGDFIGKDQLRISHLIYLDDVIFTGEWSHSNAQNLLSILWCFFLVSGLKINVHKSYLTGICVSDVDISSTANLIGCGVSKLPLKYLGVPVGCNMTQLISVGGRLSLIKSVLNSLPTYFMSIYKVHVSICSKLESMRNKFFIGSEIGEKKLTWVSWRKCLASKNLGGLDIGSIFALNAGLLFKWIWQFMRNSNDLWAKVLKAIHGHNGGIHVESMYSPIKGTWSGILFMINSLKLKGIDLLSLCVRKVGNGASIQFWKDTWCGSQPLKSLFLRIHLLDNDKGCYVVDRISSHDWSSSLRRNPRGGIEASQLMDLQNLIRDVVLSDHSDS
ncbi:putative RNA-directed DNA polymerase, eukaryota, reverse transcriptase zinc-binding domain protein [Tanacetum coccineum]